MNIEEGYTLRRLNLEVSAVCNYACCSCPNTYFSRKKGHMPERMFLKIFDEVGNDLDRVLLWNYGEPLLNPNIASMLEQIRGYRTTKVMSTTGYRLEDFSDLEFMTAIDEIVVSINGLTQEVYESHQKGGDLEKVKRGLKKLKKVLEGSPTKLVLQMVANSYNLKEIEGLDEFAKEFGFDEVTVKSFNVMDNKKETMMNFVPFGTVYSRYGEKGLVRSPPITGGPCLEWMVINWNGDVNVCCWDYDSKYVLGNVETQGVYGVWNSPAMRGHRENIARGKYLDICIDCTSSKTVLQRKVSDKK